MTTDVQVTTLLLLSCDLRVSWVDMIERGRSGSCGSVVGFMREGHKLQ